MICTKCKKEIPDESIFCMYCGKNLSPPKKTRHANGEGCAWKPAGSKTWKARVTDMDLTSRDPETKKLKRKTHEKSGFPSEREARLWCRRYYDNKDKEQEKPEAPSLSHYWDLFRDGELESMSGSKQTAYKIAWGKLKSISGYKMDRITITDLRDVVSDNAKTFYPARDMKALLSHLFKLAAADRYVDKDLPSFIVLPKLEEKEKEVFSETEQAALWKAFDAGNLTAAWPLLMIYTGMMPGETMKLTIPMIDFEGLKITGSGLKTSTRKESAIHFPVILVPVLQAVIGDRTEGKVFVRNKDNLYKDYHELVKAIGIRDLDPYSCRHTMATALAVNKNVAPETLRKAMRWSTNSRMAPRYVHPDDSDVAAAVAATRPTEETNIATNIEA